MLNVFQLANYHWLKYLIYHKQDLKIYMLQVYIFCSLLYFINEIGRVLVCYSVPCIYGGGYLNFKIGGGDFTLSLKFLQNDLLGKRIFPIYKEGRCKIYMCACTMTFWEEKKHISVTFSQNFVYKHD